MGDLDYEGHRSNNPHGDRQLARFSARKPEMEKQENVNSRNAKVDQSAQTKGSSKPRFEEICRTFSNRMRTIPEVEAVLAYADDPNCFLWTVTNLALEDRIRDSVYEAEYDLLTAYPEMHCDFYLLERHDRPLDAIKPAGFRAIYERQIG